MKLDTFEPYTIHCVTCNAQLRVARREAIGKIVACPNCHSMVQIEAATPAAQHDASQPSTKIDSVKDSVDGSVSDPVEADTLSDRLPSASTRKLPQWIVLSLAAFTGITFSIGLWSVVRGTPDRKTPETANEEQSSEIGSRSKQGDPSQTPTSAVQVAATTLSTEPPAAPVTKPEEPLDVLTDTSVDTQPHSVATAEENETGGLNNPLREAGTEMEEKGGEAESANAEVTSAEVTSESIPQLPLPPPAESLQAKMKISLERIQFPDIPLRSAVAILAQFSNVEIAVDHAALIRAGLSPETGVSLQSENSSVLENLEKLLQPLGLVAIPSGDLIFISLPDSTDQTLSEETYALDLAQDAKATEQLIRTVIFPTSWQTLGGPATIRREGNKLWITQTKAGHSATHRLLTLLQQTGRGTFTPGRNSVAGDPLNQIIDFTTREAVPLNTYVHQLSGRVDSPIVIDALDMLRHGISSRQLIKVEAEKKSLADLIEQTLGPLGLIAQTMDDRSVIITTVKGDNETRPLLRIYPISEALAMDHEALVAMITERVAPNSWADTGGNGRIALDKHVAALVVLQRPDIQREVLEFVTGFSAE